VADVAVKGTDGCAKGAAPGVEVAGGLEGAVAVAQEHAHGARVEQVGPGEVEDAVAVEVRRHHPAGPCADSVALGDLEGAVAIAQEHADGAAAIVGDGEVGAAVAVEVPHRLEAGYGVYPIGNWRKKTRERAVF